MNNRTEPRKVPCNIKIGVTTLFNIFQFTMKFLRALTKEIHFMLSHAIVPGVEMPTNQDVCFGDSSKITEE